MSWIQYGISVQGLSMGAIKCTDLGPYTGSSHKSDPLHQLSPTFQIKPGTWDNFIWFTGLDRVPENWQQREQWQHELPQLWMPQQLMLLLLPLHPNF